MSIDTGKHTNGFIDLDGVPYLLGEYVDKNTFRQIDRSLIKSEIVVDTNDAMRAIIDINIDDIGKRSDGMPKIIGNQTKQKNLIEMIKHFKTSLNNQLDVLRNGIVIVISYQLENQRTYQVIRSAKETIRVRNRNYFLDINPRDIDDNAIIINFFDTLQSTINQFTHGTDRMLIRITNIQMFYECVRRNVGIRPHNEYNPNELHNYHLHNQHEQYIGVPNIHDHDIFNRSRNSESIMPSDWTMFNRFYHFDDNAKDIIIHSQELNDTNTNVYQIPCGFITVNREFFVNPGHMIIFKINIWKNDLTAVNNTQLVAKYLGVRSGDHDWNDHHNHKHDNRHDHHNHKHDNRHDHHDNHHSVIISLIKELLGDKINDYSMEEIIAMVINFIKGNNNSCDYIPFTEEEIRNIIDNVFNR